MPRRRSIPPEKKTMIKEMSGGSAMSNDNEEKIMTVEIEPGAVRGEYANYVKIQHTPIDFRFDFAKVMPDENMMFVCSRLFMSPLHAKMFLSALKDNLDKYEKQFGPIEVRGDKVIPIPGPPSREKH
jgi:hypothetical protein